MALSQAQLIAIRNQFVDEALSGPCPFVKADLQNAAAAVDNWATANATSFNTALPEPFKSTATAAQKAALLSFVTLKRWAG
jgi:hypothetical protein